MISIQLLRFVAALLVFAGHMPQQATVSWLPILGVNSLFHGAIGVDLFFCISGLVMAHSTQSVESGSKPAFAFLLKRFFRIVPLYLIASTAMTVHHFFRGDIDHLLQKYLVSIVFVPYYENSKWFDPVVFPGWTLNYEIFFYAMIGIAICISSRFMLVVCAIMVCASAAGMLTLERIYYVTSINMEFVFGIALYYLLRRTDLLEKVEPYRWPLLVASVALLALVMTGRDDGYPLAGAVQRMSIVYNDTMVPRWIAWGIPSALLVYAVLLFERQVPKKLAQLGDYSYSFYLLQLFTVAAFARFAGLFPTVVDVLSRFGLLALCLFLAHLAVSYVSYVTIERPFQKFGHRLAKRYAS